MAVGDISKDVEECVYLKPYMNEFWALSFQICNIMGCVRCSRKYVDYHVDGR